MNENWTYQGFYKDWRRKDGLVVFPSAAEKGSWMVGGPGFELFADRYFGSAEAAMQAVDAADKAKKQRKRRWTRVGFNRWRRVDGIYVLRARGEHSHYWYIPDRLGTYDSAEEAMGVVDGTLQRSPLETWDTGPVDVADKAKKHAKPDGDRSVMVVPAMTGPDQHCYTDDNPKTTYGDKRPPLHLVPPALIIGAGEVFKLGASKYGPYNWREKRVSSSVYQGAALRHLLAWWDGEENDPESGESHLAHAAACVGILLDAQAVGNLNDNRPVAGKAAELIREREEKE